MKMKMKILLLAVATVMSSVLSTGGKRVTKYILYVYVCMHVTNLLTHASKVPVPTLVATM